MYKTGHICMKWDEKHKLENGFFKMLFELSTNGTTQQCVFLSLKQHDVVPVKQKYINDYK